MTSPARPTITFFRLASGRISVYDETSVVAGEMTMVESLLTPGRHKLPHSEYWLVDIAIAADLLTAIIDIGGGPLVRASVVLKATDLACVVRPPRVLDLPAPVCVIEVLKDLPYDPVVGDVWSFVYTLAWSWLRCADRSETRAEDVTTVCS